MLQCAWLVALIHILSTVGQFPMQENKCSTCEETYSCLTGECNVTMVEFCSTELSKPSCLQQRKAQKNETCGEFFDSATRSDLESTMRTTGLCQNSTSKNSRTVEQPSLCDCCRERINKCAQQIIGELATIIDDSEDPTHGASGEMIQSGFDSQTCTRTYRRFVCAKLLRRRRNDTLCGDFCCRIRLECPFFRVEDNQLYGGQPALSCEEKSPTGCFSYSNISTTSSTTNFTENLADESWSDPCSSSKGSNLSSFPTILISFLGLFVIF